MPFPRHLRALLLPAALALWAAPAAACPGYDDARAAATVHEARAALGKLRTGCARQQRNQGRRWVALALQRAAERAYDPLPLLEEAARARKHWRVMQALGDVRVRRALRDADAKEQLLNDAACAYNDALHDVDSYGLAAPHEDPPPSAGDVDRMQDALEEALLVLERMPYCPRNRGRCRLRDEELGSSRAAAPVYFANNSAEITTEGRRAAASLAECLAGLPPSTPYAYIVGHASTIGTHAHNCGLSRRRAQATIRAIRAIRAERSGPLPFPLIPIGRGELDPYKPQTGAPYTPEDILTMSRRVVAEAPDSRGQLRSIDPCVE